MEAFLRDLHHGSFYLSVWQVPSDQVSGPSGTPDAFQRPAGGEGKPATSCDSKVTESEATKGL